jgi:hypothetical protein
MRENNGKGREMINMWAGMMEILQCNITAPIGNVEFYR